MVKVPFTQPACTDLSTRVHMSEWLSLSQVGDRGTNRMGSGTEVSSTSLQIVACLPDPSFSSALQQSQKHQKHESAKTHSHEQRRADGQPFWPDSRQAGESVRYKSFGPLPAYKALAARAGGGLKPHMLGKHVLKIFLKIVGPFSRHQRLHEL